MSSPGGLGAAGLMDATSNRGLAAVCAMASEVEVTGMNATTQMTSAPARAGKTAFALDRFIDDSRTCLIMTFLIVSPAALGSARQSGCHDAALNYEPRVQTAAR